MAGDSKVIKAQKPVDRWWFGGVSAMMAATITHPLDTLKVRMQTATEKASFVRTTINVVQKEGIRKGLYAGLSASLLRQLFYSTSRFGVNDLVKSNMKKDEKGRLNIWQQLVAAMSGGFAGGILGTPADLTNVRMQSDGRLPPEQRRGYKNAIHGLYRIAKDEGAEALFRGWVPNTQRAVLMTVGQIVSYDISKQTLIGTGYFGEGPITHFTASLTAGLIATTICSPLDVVKTRIMSSPPNFYKGTLDAFSKILRNEGPLAFLKGW